MRERSGQALGSLERISGDTCLSGILNSGEAVKDLDLYRFLPASCLLATAACFCCAALLALACFWLDFLCVDFGDLSPIISLLLMVDWPAAWKFLRRHG